MGQISITFATSTGLSQTESFALPDAAIERMVEWARDAYPTEPTEANPNPNRPTIAQGLRRMARGLVRGIRDNTIRHERDKAQRAVAEPADITV